MNIQPLWEEAARRVANGDPWLVGSTGIATLLGVESVTKDDLLNGYDPSFSTSFRFDEWLGKGHDAFSLWFTKN